MGHNALRTNVHGDLSTAIGYEASQMSAAADGTAGSTALGAYAV